MSKHKITHRDHNSTFPWGWFVFFGLCLFGGGEGLVLFACVFGFAKVFTKLIRS